MSFGDEETGTERLNNLLKVIELVRRVLRFISKYIITKSCNKPVESELIIILIFLDLQMIIKSFCSIDELYPLKFPTLH